MNSRAGMALYRAMILGLHLCQSSAFGGRRSAVTLLSAPRADLRCTVNMLVAVLQRKTRHRDSARQKDNENHSVVAHVPGLDGKAGK